MDDALGLTKSLLAAPLADEQRRKPVIDSLNSVTATEEEAVLKQAKAIFTVQQWIVHGDFYQVVGDFHYHEAPTQAKVREAVLRGQVFFVEDNDELTSAAEVSVTLLQTADRVVTGPEGLFALSLPDACQPGIKVELSVRKDGWVIFSPLAGEITVPALEADLVKVRLVRMGSTKLLSDESVKKLIQDMVGKSKEQIQTEGQPQDIDLSRYIQDWATKYGFSPQRVKAEIDKWVTEAEQQNDPYQLGLAAYAKKNFGEASKLFEASAENRLKKIDEAKSKAQLLTQEAVTDFRLAGDARYNQYEFDPALTLCQQALQLLSKEEESRLWAEITIDIGRAHGQIGLRTHGDRIHHHLAEAVTAYRAALTVYTQAELPQQWAGTQNNLGNVLGIQGTRTGGEAGTRLLAEVVTAYRAALTVRTQAELPQDWAMTQNNLGIALGNQGIRTSGESGTRLLAEAVAAYRAALTVRTQAELPQDWAATQNNLGIALGKQGTRTGGEDGKALIRQAITAYELALEVMTKNALPVQWKQTMDALEIAKKALEDMK